MEKSTVRQFVAVPWKGYSAEEQITGGGEHGSLQLEAYAMRAVAGGGLKDRNRRRGSPCLVYIANASFLLGDV